MSRRRRRPLRERPRKHRGRRNRLSRKRGAMATRRLGRVIADQIWKEMCAPRAIHRLFLRTSTGAELDELAERFWLAPGRASPAR